MITSNRHVYIFKVSIASLQVPQDLLDLLGPVVTRVLLEGLDSLEIVALRAQLGRRAVKETLDHLVPEDFLDQLDQLDQQDRQVLLVVLDHRDKSDLLVEREIKDNLVGLVGESS